MKKTITIFIIFVLIVSIVIGIMTYMLIDYKCKLYDYEKKLEYCERKLAMTESDLKKKEYNEIHMRNIIKKKGLRGYFNDAPMPVQTMLDMFAATIAPDLY